MKGLATDYLADDRHGPLPAMLLAMTVATGVVDAVSIISLGRVFVANMTGNIAFIGFALAGAPGFSLLASLVALVAFLVGAGLGGSAITRLSGHRGKLLAASTAGQLVLLGAATIVTATSSRPLGGGARDAAVALAAVALGVQNAVARNLAVPDMTTTVLTMTLTGIAADIRRGNLRVGLRRTFAVLAMLVGALAGAELVLHVGVPAGFALAAAIIAVVTVSAAAVSRTPRDWQTPTP